MNKVFVLSAAAAVALALAGCGGGKLDIGTLKQVETHKVGGINVVLLNETEISRRGRTNSSCSSRINRGSR
jgi:hypothetical protein